MLKTLHDSLAALESYSHTFGGETWEIQCAQLDAEWSPLVDEKGRKVHGYAVIEEIPAHMLGRALNGWTLPDKAFSVRLYATRDGSTFGAIPRATRYATREEAVAHARKGLVQQGKRYAKKYGGAA